MAVLKLELQNSVYRLGMGVGWAGLRALGQLVSSPYRNGKDLVHQSPRCKTSLSPVALSFAELEPVYIHEITNPIIDVIQCR